MILLRSLALSLNYRHLELWGECEIVLLVFGLKLKF